MKFRTVLLSLAVVVSAAVIAVPDRVIEQAEAGPKARGGAPHSVNRSGGNARPQAQASQRSSANRSSSRSSSSSRNVNVNNNVNIDRHVDVDIDADRGWDNDWNDHYHPVATAAAVTATVAVTSAVIGSIVNTVPSGCVTTVVNGIAYQQCGSTWYEPRYSGSSVQYVVINSPY